MIKFNVLASQSKIYLPFMGKRSVSARYGNEKILSVTLGEVSTIT